MSISPVVQHLLRYKKPSIVAAVNNTALDGAVNGDNGGGGFSGNVTLPGLTTTAAGKVIVFVEYNGLAADITSVSGSTLGSFTQRAFGGSQLIFEYHANSSGALTSEVITITTGSHFCEATAFGVKGVNTGVNNGFDSNGALPNIVSSGNGSITTSNANDFLIAGFRGGGDTAVSGWTQVHTGGFLSVSYLKVTSTQSGLVVTDPISNNGGICDALVST